MDSLSIASCGFLKSTGGYGAPEIITFGFLDELGEPPADVLTIFEVLRARVKVVKIEDPKKLNLRLRKFKS